MLQCHYVCMHHYHIVQAVRGFSTCPHMSWACYASHHMYHIDACVMISVICMMIVSLCSPTTIDHCRVYHCHCTGDGATVGVTGQDLLPFDHGASIPQIFKEM